MGGKLKECSIATTMGKTTYQQSTEDFDSRDIVVKCVFTDGTTQNLGYEDLIVRILNKEMRIPLTLTHFSTKVADKALLTTQPADSYKVGEAFRADEYTLRCFCANGTRIYDGYRFKEASTKNVLLRLGDYSVKTTLTIRN